MADAQTVYHRGARKIVTDWYDWFFEHGMPGDWKWDSLTHSDGSGPYLVLLGIFPLIGREPAGANKIELRGGELCDIYMSRQSDDWAQPGPVTGWDGNRDAPTLNGSIYIRGREEVKGWHGFIHEGRMVNLDGSIVGA